MSLARKAARGAAWTILTSLGGRAVGVVGTLIMTRFLAPEVIGEVSAASIVVFTANWLTLWGFNQYFIVKGRGPDAVEVSFHTTVFHLALGLIGMVVIALVGHHFADTFEAPHLGDYIPGLAIAVGIRRLGSVPEKVLYRSLQFRAAGLSLTAGEVTYTVVALLLAWRGWGGMSVVYANIAQSMVMTAIVMTAADWREWLTPCRLRWARVKEMLRYGLPLGVEAVAHNASRYWDNLLVSRYFGPSATGMYNMAYNLADIPAIHIGEQIAQVLLPSMAELPPERRGAALQRATALLSLLIFPLAIGLGVIADSLVPVILAEEWHGVAPLLTVLTVVSVFRPVSWVLSAYLQAQHATMRLMVIEIAKLGLLLVGIAGLAQFGLQASAASVGIAFGLTALAGVWMVVRTGGVSPWGMWMSFARPLIACGVMAAAVLGVRYGLIAVGVDSPYLLLPIEIVVGAAVYIPTALVVCRDTAHDFIDLARGLISRRRGGDDASGPTPTATTEDPQPT